MPSRDGSICSAGSGNDQNQLVVTQQEMVKAESGGSVNISCSSMALYPVYSVEWTLGCNLTTSLTDLPYFQYRVKLFTTDPVQAPQSPQVPTYEIKATLTIINLTENDSGRFCCHVMLGGGKKGTGNGTRLEVAPRSCPAGQKDQGSLPKLYILYAVVGAEACIILILIAVVMRYRPRGFWRSDDQTLQSDPSEVQYVEISRKKLPSRPKINVDAVTYSAVKAKRDHRTNQGYESY
ncbi:uncharacterized protein [Eleutherodactylus coqui]|uniref:uncharacterized protein n=1 Tax=Eleutherodactylus coqui TaxID=57060 RepID=UPI0034619B20